MLFVPKNFNPVLLPEPLREPAKIFLHTIITHMKNKHDWVHLFAGHLYKQVGRNFFRPTCDALIHAGIVERSASYFPGWRSYGYRLGAQYQTISLSQVTDKKTIKRILKNLPAPRVECQEPIHWRIFACVQKLEIDYAQCLQLDCLEQANIVNRLLPLHNLALKRFFFTVDERGRVYHNGILWKGFRPLLSIDGQRLIEIDIPNSQPLLFCSLLTKLNNNTIPSPSPHHNKIAKSDISEWLELAQKGEIYAHLIQSLQWTGTTQHFKRRFFESIFYCKNDAQNRLRTKFKTLFPNVSAAIDYCKRDDYKDLPLALQRLEAEIVIHTACPMLAPEVPLITIHDSILTTPEHAGAVVEALQSAFAMYGLSVQPKVKIFDGEGRNEGS